MGGGEIKTKNKHQHYLFKMRNENMFESLIFDSIESMDSMDSMESMDSTGSMGFHGIHETHGFHGNPWIP